MKDGYGPGLDSLQAGHTVGLRIESDNTLHLYVNDIDQGVAAKDIPTNAYVVMDLYGQCQQVTVVTSGDCSLPSSLSQEYREKADIEEGVTVDLSFCGFVC